MRALSGPFGTATPLGPVQARQSYLLEGQLQEAWLLLGTAVQDMSQSVRGAQAATTTGWVRRSVMRVTGDLTTVPKPPYLRIASWVTLGANVRRGPNKAYDRLQTLTNHSVWYRVIGKNAADATWWRIQVNASTYGWIYASLVDVIGDSSSIPVQNAASPIPAAAGPTGETATGTGSTSGSAAGDFRNLVTNPDGRWAVWKSGTTVTANFSSPRSPVQYYARQHPQPQFVLPVGFRPTGTVTHTVKGTRVKEDRTPVPQAAAATFDLTIGTNGEMRYVNNRKVAHLGYVSYSVTHLRWQTKEALVVPTQTGTLQGNGVYLNQATNRGSSWRLTRSRGGTRVTGTFSCTRSPVDYHANGKPGRAAILLLPTEYRPASDTRIQVTGAVRVNENGSDSTDTRKVNFWLTMQRDGYMWYDADTSLRTQGVGYLRYTVNVSWTATQAAGTPLTFTWTWTAAAGEVVTGWRLEFQILRFSRRWFRLATISGAPARTHTSRRALGADAYRFRLVAVTGRGDSPPSNEVAVRLT